MNTRIFMRILQMNKNELNAYDSRHLTVNLRVGELKLRFNLQSSPMGVLFNNCTLIKSGSKQYTSSRFLPPPPPPPSNFLFKEILFKLLTFRYTITRKSEESSRNLCLCYILLLSVLLALGSSDRWYIRKGTGLSYYMKGARNPPPFDDFQKGLRAVSRIHSSYQDEPWQLVISLTTGLECTFAIWIVNPK